MIFARSDSVNMHSCDLHIILSLRCAEQKDRIPCVNPRNTIIATIATLWPALALADDFKTISGKEYKDVTVSRVEAKPLNNSICAAQTQRSRIGFTFSKFFEESLREENKK